MRWRVEDVLSILDDCCANYSFPALDNGYIYPAAARLSLHHSDTDWAIVIETFGYSPREGAPATVVQTFASRLINRDRPEDYRNHQAYENYLRQNPHNEFRSVYPFDDDWEDIDDKERVAEGVQEIRLRGALVRLPSLTIYPLLGIELQAAPRVHIFELCRAFASLRRDDVLATFEERRQNVDPTLREILVLDEWRHPDFIEQNERPSDTQAFRQLALAAVTGDASHYRSTVAPNTHWRHWPLGGSL